ncbi:MAG: DUF192 domain-containing protein [Pseudomonadota bacterium]
MSNGLLLALRFLFVLAVVPIAAPGCARSETAVDPDSGLPLSALSIETSEGVHAFTVEVATENKERQVGLMFRTELADDAGMLFDFRPAKRVSMWMKNTLIPLDMAFIDDDGTITRITAETTPRSLQPLPSGGRVAAVLEVRGGLLAELGVKVGDKVRHDIFK